MTTEPIKHTPGPYTYRRSTDGCDDTWEIIADFAESPLAFVPFWADEDDAVTAQAEANARLFAASPKLLDAVTHFFSIMHDYESSVEKGYVQQAMQQARAIIEQATGRPA
jgi:hypothetical protein